MSSANPKQWPRTVLITLALCPRCGGSHKDVEYQRFELGDQNFTHWAYCETSGEPLLLDMSARSRRLPDKFRVRFNGTGRKPIPEDPHKKRPYSGVDIVTPCAEGAPFCVVPIPFPAKEIGGWMVECTECQAKVSCAAHGRHDDPRSITLPCLKKKTQ